MKFVKLAISVMVRKENFKEALRFLEDKKGYYDKNIVDKQMQEAAIHHKAGNSIATINAYFKVLKLNSTLAGFQQLWPIYH